jgi:hypothetical protein
MHKPRQSGHGARRSSSRADRKKQISFPLVTQLACVLDEAWRRRTACQSGSETNRNEDSTKSRCISDCGPNVHKCVGEGLTAR